jgi:hypothetical protein
VKARSHLYTTIKPYGEAVKVKKKDIKSVDESKFVI